MASPTVAQILLEQGYTKEQIESFLLAGLVYYGDEKVRSRGMKVPDGARLVVRESNQKVNRAQEKLEGALVDAGVDVSGRVCIDLGASHGGFTRALLERGARRVYAVDVAYGILDYRVRNHPGVVVLERTHVKSICEEWFLPEDWNREFLKQEEFFIVADLSFISILTVSDYLLAFFNRIQRGFEGLFLVKPQFEDSSSTDHGVIRDPEKRKEILDSVVDELKKKGFTILDGFPSQVKGARGNQEFFVLLKKNGEKSVSSP